MSLVIVVVVALAGLPGLGLGATGNLRQQEGTITGIAVGANRAPLANQEIRLRNVSTGQIFGSTMTNGAGQFTFLNVPPGTYVIEVVDSRGKVIGLSPSLGLSAGGSANVPVSATAMGTLTTGNGGFSLLGLGPAASYSVIGAAGTVAVVGIVAATNKSHASPSK
jgi:hypothetical protein